MNELLQKNDSRATIRWKLLTGASALALISTTALATADDADRSQVWIELGGQLSRLQDSQETFAPVFTGSPSRPSIFSPSSKFEAQPTYNMGEFAGISFQPSDSDWLFTASIKYGRATKTGHVRQQTQPPSSITFHEFPTYPLPPYASILIHAKPKAARFADTRVRNDEQYSVVDFQAGKDVGIGLFGKDSSSTVSLGVRFAQFREKSNVAIASDPDWHFQHKYFRYYGIEFQSVFQPYHSNAAGLHAQRSFSGVGPSLSWNSSMPFAGNVQDGELVLDWGVNAAALFGRQNTRTQHHTTVRFNSVGIGVPFRGNHALVTKVRNTPLPQTHSRDITVPNVGGSVGFSWKLQGFKMSLGYRADFFFNAIDGGIDARKNENRAFYGPYASISIGLGD